MLKKTKVKLICYNCKKEFGFGVITADSSYKFEKFCAFTKRGSDYFNLRIACCEGCANTLMEDGNVEI